ncbi:MAG: SURF1 family protein [Gammaproteobacteria bacterium]|jgi:surfeit locus 1 family protein
MFSVTGFRFSFTSSWKMLCLALVSICLLISLGIWQLHRAAEKRGLLAMYQTQMQRAPVALSGTSAQQYQRVQVQGLAQLPITLLLDNQHHAHQFGYDVLTPLIMVDGNVLLIDQGWVPGDPSRVSLPDMTGLQSDLHYSGQVYYPAKSAFVLGVGLEVKTPNVIVIESLNMTMISQFLHKPVYPFIIRQSAERQTRFVRDWPIVASSPVRHIGYAVQWFIFALGVGVMFIVFHTKRLT